MSELPGFSGKSVLVIGMARSGVAAAEKLDGLGASVLAIDSNTALKRTARELEKKGIKTHLGEHRFSDLDGIELLVVSPGVMNTSPILMEAGRRHIPIWSEVELAYRLTAAPIIGVTGTNGKTTTTALLGRIFAEAGRSAVTTGNIGFPLVKAIDQARSDTVLIAELSSFQLKNIADFRPRVGVLLNITEDHLDWHPDFDDYIEAKGRLFLNQAEDDWAVVNYDDEIVRGLLVGVKSRQVPFSKLVRVENGVYVEGGEIVAGLVGGKSVCRVDELKIKGEHNLDNAMAAAGAALALGLPIESIGEALRRFEGLKHRLEYVATLDGVDYYNDSKATNPDATVKALTAFKNPIILLLGGRNKGNSFLPLARVVKGGVHPPNGGVKVVIVFGEVAEEIRRALVDCGVRVLSAATLSEAVKLARDCSIFGDVVLLSPACASFDMFSNYEERGEAFKGAVLGLGEDFRG